jgi:hypothetical protein
MRATKDAIDMKLLSSVIYTTEPNERREREREFTLKRRRNKSEFLVQNENETIQY